LWFLAECVRTGDEGDEAMGDATRVKVERSAKRVRAYLGGEIIVDSIRSKLVWEVPQYPAYYFPMADVRMHHLAESDRKQRSSSRGEARYFDVHGGNRMAANSAWHYPESPVFEIQGHLRFEWDQMDAWFEEEEEVFVHAHDPYKRIDILHSSRHIEVSLDGVKLADTRRPTIVYETGAPIRYYVPKPDVRMDFLEPSDKRTGCAYKGFARYWSLNKGKIKRDNIAWSYAMPIADCAKIAGLVAFYNEHVDLLVDGVPEERRQVDANE
jgi:uncharacterized protein (DUF427 family)